MNFAIPRTLALSFSCPPFSYSPFRRARFVTFGPMGVLWLAGPSMCPPTPRQNLTRTRARTGRLAARARLRLRQRKRSLTHDRGPAASRFSPAAAGAAPTCPRRRGSTPSSPRSIRRTSGCSSARKRRARLSRGTDSLSLSPFSFFDTPIDSRVWWWSTSTPTGADRAAP